MLLLLKSFFTCLFLLPGAFAYPQPAYTLHDIVDDFPANKILNFSPAASSFKQLNDKLTVVDFFGTWCVPCIKALPKLSALQEKYKDQIRILLVSVEEEVKLKNFISKRENFNLPLVVDENEQFTSRFRPPAYPYTVIVAKNGKVLAIPQQEEITEENIEKWIAMQEAADIAGLNPVIKDTSLITATQPLLNNMPEPSSNKLVQLSQEFIYDSKTGEPTDSYREQLKNLSMQELMSTIQHDDEKKAFWINLYNAFTQVYLQKNPEQYTRRGQFFGSKQIEIAGRNFSLDDLEHGILRRSKIKWSLGYFNKLFPGKTEKQLRVDRLDYRLHFALNCGARSCPPIAFYKPETINQQLELAAKAYLGSEAVYDEATNTVALPRLMSWFRSDFGGKRKMIELLKKSAVIPAEKRPRIKFKEYDWTLYLNNYK